MKLSYNHVHFPFNTLPAEYFTRVFAKVYKAINLCEKTFMEFNKKLSTGIYNTKTIGSN